MSAQSSNTSDHSADGYKESNDASPKTTSSFSLSDESTTMAPRQTPFAESPLNVSCGSNIQDVDEVQINKSEHEEAGVDDHPTATETYENAGVCPEVELSMGDGSDGSENNHKNDKDSDGSKAEDSGSPNKNVEIVKPDCDTGKVNQTFIDSLRSEVVTIFVGPDRVKFSIHKERLCAKSEYFQKAFNGGFIEATTSSLSLDDISVKVFSSFAEWIYRDNFNLSKVGVNGFIDLYLFSDRILSNPFKNYIMDRLQNHLYTKSTKIPKTKQIQRVLENTLNSKTSPIRKFFAAAISHYLCRGQAITPSIEKLFCLPEFLKEFVAFQNEVCDIQAAREPGEVTVGLSSDPYVRKWKRDMEEEDMCCYDCYVNSHHGSVAEDVGFPICFFHVHGKGDGEKCKSVPNYYDSDEDEDDDYGCGW